MLVTTVPTSSYLDLSSPQEGLTWQPHLSAAKSLQSCLTLCDLIDGSPPGSPIPGILQARTLEWVAISFSNVGKCKVNVKSLSRVRLLATPWTAAYQAPPSMGFSRQEYWSGWPLPSPTYIHIHRHTHTHIYIYIHNCPLVSVGNWFQDCPGYQNSQILKHLI